MPDVIRTVIFDIDDTLYHFREADAAAIDALAAYAAEHFGWPKERFRERHAEVRLALVERQGMSGSCRSRILRFQQLLEEEGLPLFPHAAALHDLYWETLFSAMEPYEGCPEVVRELKERDLRIGIGTDMTAYMQLRKLEKLGVLPYVDFMVSSEEAGWEKPSQAFFGLCAKKAQCAPGECLFIGDNAAKDYEGALAAGMHALLFAPDREAADGTDVIRALPEILDYPGIPGESRVL